MIGVGLGIGVRVGPRFDQAERAGDFVPRFGRAACRVMDLAADDRDREVRDRFRPARIARARFDVRERTNSVCSSPSLRYN